MNALKLKKQASAYNKKQHRDRGLKEYKLLKKRIQVVSKNGQYEFYSLQLNIESDVEKIIAHRLFLRRQKGFKCEIREINLYHVIGLPTHVQFIISWD